VIPVLYIVEKFNTAGPLNAGFERPYFGPEVGLEKEGQADAVLRARIDDAVGSASPLAVGPSLHHVANVDDECAGDGVCVDPRAVSGLYLESARRLVG
jgi:hypothetical protein